MATATTANDKREVSQMGRRTMMRTAAGLFGALAVGALATGCAFVGGDQRSSFNAVGPAFTGSGKSATRDYKLANFSAIEIGSAFKVDIAQATDFAVSVTADDNLLDQVDVFVEGETLQIRMKRGSYMRADYRASVKLPTLKRLDVSGASAANLIGIKTNESLDLRASGASKIDGRAEANSLKLDLSGASHAKLTGAASSATVELSGASGGKLEDLATKRVRANLSGASTAGVDASENLDVNLSGASRLTYAGQAKISSQSITGASQLARK